MELTQAQWSRVEELFGRVLDEGPASAPGALDDARDDAAVARELRSMLEASGAAPGFLEKPVAVTLPGTVSAAQPAIAFGTLLGAWRVIDAVGRGGMGEVYLVERADGAFQMRAALKLLKRGLDTDALLARFLRERRILAQLAHPNIVHVLDAGAAPDGRPWLVMEHVDGQSIDDWCLNRSLGTREVVQLFAQVCDAVQEAHRKGVIHRDLKPGNVLVTDSGEPKLLDFGIAKMISEQGPDETVFGAAAPLTPQYAAPEQLLGEPVSAATDVYALGAMLYQLLTREPVNEATSLPAAVIAAQGGTRNRRAPSTAIRASPRFALPAERKRRGEECAGELDVIVQKALHPEAARRYADAGAFDEDLRRYLDHRPITAQPDSFGYRAKKFLRRNRLMVGAVAAVFAALLTGLVLAAWQAHVARIEARRADDEAVRATHQAGVAQAESARVRRVKQFFVSVFAEGDPLRTSGPEPTLPQALDHAIARVETEFHDDPRMQGDLFEDLGEIRGERGDIAGAEPLFRRALALREQTLGPDDPLVADTLQSLCVVAANLGRDREAMNLQTRAVSILERHADTHGEALASARNAMAIQLNMMGREHEALAYAQKAVAYFRKDPGPKEQQLAISLSSLGAIESGLGDAAAARPDLEEARDMFERNFGPDSVNLVTTLQHLAWLDMEGGDFASADALANRALAIVSRLDGYDDWSAATLRILGQLRVQQDRAMEAEAYFAKALVDFRASGQHSEVASVLDEMADIAYDRADYAKALQLEDRAANECAQTTSNPVLCAKTAAFRATVLARLDRGAEALEEIGPIVAFLDKGAPRRSAYAYGLVRRAEILTLLGRDEDAEGDLRLALGLHRDEFGADDPHTLALQRRLARVLVRRGGADRFAEAETLLAAPLPESTSASELGWQALAKAELAHAQGRRDDARAGVREAFGLLGPNAADHERALRDVRALQALVGA